MNDLPKKLTIENILNCKSGKNEDARVILSRREADVFELRRRLIEAARANKPIYVCGVCGQPVKIEAHRTITGSHASHFKHFYKSGDCPIKTDSNYTKKEIEIMKYNGVKVSKAHQDLVGYIVKFLKKDPRINDIKVEKVIKGKGWSKQWRKPDISANFQGKTIVFELQLSSIFLSTIIEREEFYRLSGIPIFWVFNNLNPQDAIAADKDIFFNNQTNAFSLDKISRSLSKENQKLTFTCHYQEPWHDVDNDLIIDRWVSSPASLDDIHFDKDSSKPQFKPYNALLLQTNKLANNKSRSELLKIFESYILDKRPLDRKMMRVTDRLLELQILSDINLNYQERNLLKALLSVRDNYVYFNNQRNKWNWVTNYVWIHCIDYWVAYLFTVNEYEREEVIFPKKNHKINSKRKIFQEGYKVNLEFQQSVKLYPIIIALLPKLEPHLSKRIQSKKNR